MNFQEDLGGLPACTREVGGTQVTVITLVSIPLEGIRKWEHRQGRLARVMSFCRHAQVM